MLEPTREEQARFETTLRGGTLFRTDDRYYIWIGDRDTGDERPALDITTDTGLLDAMELNPHWELIPILGGGYVCRAQSSNNDKWVSGKPARDAIRAAWYAAVNADKERHA